MKAKKNAGKTKNVLYIFAAFPKENDGETHVKNLRKPPQKPTLFLAKKTFTYTPHSAVIVSV
jgi:hypothetical protein